MCVSTAPLFLIFLIPSKIDLDVLFLLFRFALLILTGLFLLLAFTGLFFLLAVLFSGFLLFFLPLFCLFRRFFFLRGSLR